MKVLGIEISKSWWKCIIYIIYVHVINTISDKMAAWSSVDVHHALSAIVCCTLREDECLALARSGERAVHHNQDWQGGWECLPWKIWEDSIPHSWTVSYICCLETISKVMLSVMSYIPTFSVYVWLRTSRPDHPAAVWTNPRVSTHTEVVCKH